jgi:hypothetical protein
VTGLSFFFSNEKQKICLDIFLISSFIMRVKKVHEMIYFSF